MINIFETKSINTACFSGDFLSGLALLEIFSWYEWIIVFLFIGIVFKYFEKYFILDD